MFGEGYEGPLAIVAEKSQRGGPTISSNKGSASTRPLENGLGGGQHRVTFKIGAVTRINLDAAVVRTHDGRAFVRIDSTSTS